MLELDDKSYVSDFELLDMASGLFSVNNRDKVCLAMVNLSSLLTQKLDEEKEGNTGKATANENINNDKGNNNSNIQRSKDTLEKFFTTKTVNTSFKIVSEISITLSFINEMCTNLTTKFDHIASFRNPGNYMGLAMIQNSVKLYKKIEQINFKGLKRVQTLYFKHNNPNKYHRYIVLSYHDYTHIDQPRLLVTDIKKNSPEIKEGNPNSFKLNLNEETI